MKKIFFRFPDAHLGSRLRYKLKFPLHVDDDNSKKKFEFAPRPLAPHSFSSVALPSTNMRSDSC